MSIDWQQVWQREYVNKPDQRWKIRSLNADNAQTYNIKLPGTPPPSPKINKVNATMFCITIDTDINLFFQQTEERRKKTNKVFSKSTKALPQKIQLVTGLTNEQGENYLVVGTKDRITLLKIVSDSNGGYAMEELPGGVKNIPEFRSLVCFGTTRILAVSAGQLHQFEVANDALKELVVKNIQFKRPQDQKDFKELKPIGIVLGGGQNFYYFGSRVEEQVDETKLKAGNQKLTPSECQALTIVELHVEIGSDIHSVSATLFPIDHIFELNLFTRTKIYEIEKETFLVSLHEEIILIKKHFGKFIVWDNVSVVSSRNETMKGQLSLTSQTIMVFSQNGQISAHQIFFDSEDKKLSMPPIDRYRGHEIDQVLYDSLMLDTTDSIMKVLVYVKPGEVVYPGVFRGGQSEGNKKKEVATTLDFAIQCINQNEPLKKLEQMIVKEKPNKEIEEFCDRYNITEQELLKSKWNVSNKELKEIETILMGIRDDPFIQNELDSILKKDSHNLEFLNNVELKQGNRLKLLLAEKIGQYTRISEGKDKKQLKKYIFDVLQWIMESDMFLKKIKYSKNFLVFKEYDFIEIGKLRAASLKEEIKLLSCKNFEKRLKYFLNEFKTLVISNFDEVFEFLLMDKSVKEIEYFIESFNFILPNFNEPSEVFIMRKNYNIMKTPEEKKEVDRRATNEKKKRQRFLSFNPTGAEINDQILGVVNRASKIEAAKQSTYREKSKMVQEDLHEGGAEKCILWEDLKEGDEIQETIEAFIDKHISQLKGVHFENEGQLERAEQNLREIIDQFCQSRWFKTAAFKQHCMITKTSQEIYNEFKELKRKKAFKILMKFLFKEVERIEEEDCRLSTKVNQRTEAVSYQEEVNEMIEKFIADGLIPQSFKRNIDARVRVYRQLLVPLSRRKPDKKTIAIELPLLSEFIVKTEPEYFQEIFYHIRDKILTEVKGIYDDIEPGFFRERFELFLKSKEVTAKEIISFLDEFNENVQADDIRIEVFAAIKRLLTLTDETNTRPYIQKSLQKEVLPQRQDTQNKLREEAKIPIGFYFVDLFKKFHLNYTYQQLIGFTNETSIEGNKIIQELIHKYCRDQYDMHDNYEGDKKVSLVSFEEVGVNDKLIDTDICGEPLEFFGLLLIFLDMLDFYTEEGEVFDLMMENYLNVGKFTELSEFILKLKNYHITEFNMNTKNYQMISDFKEWADIDRSFIEYTLEWVKKNYDSIGSLGQLEQKVQLNDRAINMLQSFSKHSPSIRKERALFNILINLMKFEPSIALNVQDIKNEAQAHSSFLFMMHMFKKIGVEQFRLISAFDETEKVEYLFRVFESHQEHIFSQKVDYLHHEFIRFLIEVCLRVIECNYYAMAKYLILFKIPNDNEYFKDVLLLFLAAADRGERLPSYSTDIVKMILTPETTSLIRNNLEMLINKHRIKGFIPVKVQTNALPVEKSNLRVDRSSDFKLAESKLIEERPEEKLQFYNSVCDVFKLTLSRHWTYDAFFLLVRTKIVRNDSLSNAAKGYFTSYSGSYDQEMLNIRFHACFLITSYCKALEQFIQKEFYPTFAFFSGKVQLLEDTKERKDVVKDINIALSKLQKMLTRNDKNRRLADCKNELEGYYEAFMESVGEDADIHLVEPDARGNTALLRTELFARTKARELEEDHMERQITEKKKQIQTNINRTHEVQEDSRLNVLNRQVNEYITEIKKGNDRHALMEAEMRKQPEQMSLAERKAKELEEIKRKEREDIESIKDTYKSNTTKRVNDLIENLRKRREEIKAKTYAPTSAVRQPMAQSSVTPAPGRNMAVNIVPAGRRAEQEQAPTTMRAKIEERLESVRRGDQGQGQSKFVELQKRLFPEAPVQSGTFNRKANFDDIVSLYRERESAEALQCIQKYDMLKNAPVRSELVKRAYSVTKSMDSFLRFIRFLIDSDPSWKESVEQKSIPIATQMLKMEPKEKLTIKDLVPVELFTKVIKVSAKDYYPYVFDMFKSNLKRIFEKELMPVHAVGILFRYSLGSENRFYNKVFYEYYQVLLKGYEIRNFDDKELTLLAEKIRSNYSSLPDSKDHVLEELLGKVANPAKKRRLLETLQKIIERKGESLVGGQANKQISYVVSKLLKA